MSVLFVLFSIAAGPGVWLSVIELILQMNPVGGEEEDAGFVSFTISPMYNDPVIPISVLAVIVVCYVLFIMFSVKHNKSGLMLSCFIVTIVCFFYAPYIIGWAMELADYFL
ncbi:hypothetical protein R70723_10425 [Paenibacillus sp. FSL R7-0273]|nr:hypothetical protein R70723_10425 [Paenibacillus sp. FSL R7-0273]OMF89356.1 hypothetical protein BK144_19470 [Paenibacillus sp. FSL R7-0273]